MRQKKSNFKAEEEEAVGAPVRFSISTHDKFPTNILSRCQFYKQLFISLSLSLYVEMNLRHQKRVLRQQMLPRNNDIFCSFMKQAKNEFT